MKRSGVVPCFTEARAIPLFREVVGGWPTRPCRILFLGGLQCVVIGIFGTNPAKGSLETTQYPISLIQEVCL